MKQISWCHYVFVSLCLINSGYAAPPSALPFSDSDGMIAEQIVKLDGLIQATEQSLLGEKRVRGLIVEYKKTEMLFLQHPEDNDILLKMVKQAAKVLEAIKERHLEPIFDSEFMEELTVLSGAASKRGIPR